MSKYNTEFLTLLIGLTYFNFQYGFLIRNSNPLTNLMRKQLTIILVIFT